MQIFYEVFDHKVNETNSAIEDSGLEIKSLKSIVETIASETAERSSQVRLLRGGFNFSALTLVCS